MNKLTFTTKEYNEASEIARLIGKIDTIDAEYVNWVSDEISKHQPFFLTVLLGYRADVSPDELAEIMKIYFLVWEFFNLNDNISNSKVTQVQFEKVQRRFMHMLHYSEAESEGSREKIYTNELQNLKSRALWTAVLLRYNNRPVLIRMDKEYKGIVLVGILSFIQCFETH